MRLFKSLLLIFIALASLSEARPSYGLSWTAFSIEVARVKGVSEQCNICVNNCGNNVLLQSELECAVAECLLQCRTKCSDETVVAVSNLLDKAVTTTDGCTQGKYAQFGSDATALTSSVLAVASSVLLVGLLN